MKLKKLFSSGALCAALAFGTSAHATGIPVFDGAAAASNVEQIAKWVAQLQEMKNQLEQAKKTYDSMTGSRGLGNIMNNPALKNYIPADWQKVYDSVKNGGYNGLTSTAKTIRDSNKVYDNCANLTGTSKEVCARSASKGAQDKDYISNALDAAKGRITQIEGLMNQINSTSDAKAIAEVQARFAAEQAMMQNEATKLQLFKMMGDAEEKLIVQQERELSSKRSNAVKMPN